MARVTLGPIVSSIAGSIGATTFNRGRNGTVAYNRPLPSRRQSAAQLFHRSLMAQAAAAWGALTEDYKKAWNYLATTEQIPTFFSQGRRWSGRQLFFCFFIAAERQYTPLPSTWLPTPPLFFSNMFLEATYWRAVAVDPPDEYRSDCTFLTAIPETLQAVYPDDYTYDCCSTVYLGIISPGQRRPPSAWIQVAPVPPTTTITTDPAYSYRSGYQYSQWMDALLPLLGIPWGTIPGNIVAVPCGFNIAVRAQALTNERIYYTQTCYGITRAGTHPNWTDNGLTVCAYAAQTPLVTRDTYPGNIPA